MHQPLVHSASGALQRSALVHTAEDWTRFEVDRDLDAGISVHEDELHYVPLASKRRTLGLSSNNDLCDRPYFEVYI